MKAEINNITKRYGKKVVLSDVSFSMEGGKIYGLLGKNGTGKSTLLSILAGTLSKDSGSFVIDGKNMFGKTDGAVGYVPQQNPLIKELTGKDNLLLWYSRGQIEKLLKNDLFIKLEIEELLKVRVKNMSGGMKKRLSIACSLAGSSGIIILDEPGAALDLVAKQTIVDFMKAYSEKGGIVLLASHEPGEISACTDHFLLRNGKVEPFNYDGNPESLAAILKETI